MNFEKLYPHFIVEKQGKRGSNDLDVGVTSDMTFSTNQSIALVIQGDFTSVCQKIIVMGYFVSSFIENLLFFSVFCLFACFLRVLK